MNGNASPRSILVSVIIPCFNQLEYTRQCLASLAHNTREAWELILVDNGSRDGTATYCAGVRDVAPFLVTILTNEENRGFPAACNQGITVARGEFIVLLNNDVVVTDAWLDQLIALVEMEPSMGMVGPMSNFASPPQLVSRVPYCDLNQMHVFAEAWRSQHRGRWMETEKLSGFCLLIRRQVLDVIGGLDERFGLGLFDDDDLSLRARRAGFKLAVALDLFVHHHGSRTFIGAGIDTDSQLSTNLSRFEQKWGLETSARRALNLVPWQPTESSGQRPSGEQDQDHVRRS